MNFRPSRSVTQVGSSTGHRWLAAATGVALALAVVLLTLRSERQARKLEMLERQVSGLAHREASIDTAPIRELGAELATRLSRTANCATGPIDSGGAETPTPTEAKSPRTESEVHTQFEALFRKESVDAHWADAARRTIESKVPSLLPVGSAMRASECRTSICRIETFHTNSDARASFLQALIVDPSRRPWDAASFSAPLSDDPSDGVMVTYLSRDGYPLPDPGSAASP